jgi:integrase
MRNYHSGDAMTTAKGLTVTAINAAKPKDKPYKLYDRDRLYLAVSVSGSRRWAWAYRLDGKDHTLKLGRFPDVSLLDARDRRADAAKLVAKGEHPKAHAQEQIAKAKAAKATTLWPICQEWIELNETHWSDHYTGQVKTYLRRYVGETSFGKRPIRAVTSAEIYELVKGVAKRKQATGVERKAEGAPHIATLLKQWLSGVFRLAIVTGRCDQNPASGFKTSDAVVKAKTKNNLALNPTQLRDVLRAVDGYGGERTTIIATNLLLLTFVRTGELRAALWPEFDLGKAIWTVPAARMKIKNVGNHVVPLSKQAVALLKELKTITGTTKEGWLFPNAKRADAPMSYNTINGALRTLGFLGGDSIGFTGHGARGTASTLLHEMGFEPAIIELQLAHGERNAVKKAYNKSQHLPARVTMMQAWADYLDSLKIEAPADSEVGEVATV